jgi:hypothetical protein
MTIRGATGGKSTSSSPWAAAAAADALDELPVIALNVSQGLVDAAALACCAVSCGIGPGAAATAPVGTATRAIAASAAGNERKRFGINNSRLRNKSNRDAGEFLAFNRR